MLIGVGYKPKSEYKMEKYGNKLTQIDLNTTVTNIKAVMELKERTSNYWMNWISTTMMMMMSNITLVEKKEWIESFEIKN